MNKVTLRLLCVVGLLAVTCAAEICDPTDESLPVNRSLQEANIYLICEKVPNNFSEIKLLFNISNHDNFQVNGHLECETGSNRTIPTPSLDRLGTSEDEDYYVSYGDKIQEQDNVTCTVTGCYNIASDSPYRLDPLSCCFRFINGVDTPCSSFTDPSSTTTLQSINVTASQFVSSDKIPSSTLGHSKTTTSDYPIPSNTLGHSKTTTSDYPIPSSTLGHSKTTTSQSSDNPPSATMISTTDHDHHWFGLFALVIAVPLFLMLFFMCRLMVAKRRKYKMLMKMRLGHGLYLSTSEVVDSEGMVDYVHFHKTRIYKELDCISVFDSFNQEENFNFHSHSDNDMGYVDTITVLNSASSPTDSSLQDLAVEDNDSRVNELGDSEQIVYDEIEHAIASVSGIGKEQPLCGEEISNHDSETDKSTTSKSTPVSPLLNQHNVSFPSSYVAIQANYQSYPTPISEGDLDLDFAPGLALHTETGDMVQHETGYVPTSTEHNVAPAVITDEEIDLSIGDDLQLDIEEDYEGIQINETMVTTGTDLNAQSYEISIGSMTSLEQLTTSNSTTASDGYIGSETTELSNHVELVKGHIELSTECSPNQSSLLCKDGELTQNGYIRNNCSSSDSTLITLGHDEVYADSCGTLTTEDFCEWDSMPIDLDESCDLNYDSSSYRRLDNTSDYILVDQQ